MAACVTAVISHPRVLTGRFQQTSGPFTMRAFSMRHTRTPVGRTMKLGCVDHVKRNHSFRLICGDKSRSGATNWCERLDRVAGEELEQQRVADVGLLDKKTMRRAGHDRELAYRKTLIQRERVFGIHLIIVAPPSRAFDNESSRHSPSTDVHRVQLALKHRRLRLVGRDEHTWQPSVGVKHTTREHRTSDERRPLHHIPCTNATQIHRRLRHLTMVANESHPVGGPRSW